MIRTGERPGQSEIASAGNLMDLAATIRRSRMPVRLPDAQQNSLSGELFAWASYRATFIGRVLASLDGTIRDKQDPRRKEFAVARTQIINKVKSDRVFSLTSEYLRSRNAPLPHILVEAEAAPETKKKSSEKFRNFDGRPYGYPDGTILRLLYLANEQYPLTLNAVRVLAYPEVFLSRQNTTWNPHTLTKYILESLKPKLKAHHNHRYEIAEAYIAEGSGRVGYYIKENEQIEPRIKGGDRRKEAGIEPKQTIVVTTQRTGNVLDIAGKPVRIKREGGEVFQNVQDGITILHYIMQNPTRYVTIADIRSILGLETEVENSWVDKSRIANSRNWLLHVFNSSDRIIIQTRMNSQGGSELKLGDAYAIEFRETDEISSAIPVSHESSN